VTDAAPVAPAQIAAGAEIAADGMEFTATLREPVAAQLAPVCTVTPSAIGPEAPAENVMLRVPAPPVMEPLVMVQA
jgi:hypothetical protein